MKCEKCGGRLERVAFNCDLDDGTELWDCFCENCGHVFMTFSNDYIEEYGEDLESENK